jgi:predicted esterase
MVPSLPGLRATTRRRRPVSAGAAARLGRIGAAGLELRRPVADRHRLLLVAPTSRLSTWDVILDGYGPDVGRIDRLLEEVAAAYPVDGLTVGGFSDGASYALSLGIFNGDLLDSVLTSSPGFAAPLIQHGSPRMFLSHGTQDRVLSIERCRRRVVPQLRRAGYEITYVEFNGAHTVPAGVVEQAAA